MKAQKILSADQYDALEFAAEVEGGVGSGVMIETDGCAVCGYGLAYLAGIVEPTRKTLQGVSKQLYKMSEKKVLPFTYMESDYAVERAQKRLKLSPDERVPFSLWAKELGLVRGE